MGGAYHLSSKATLKPPARALSNGRSISSLRPRIWQLHTLRKPGLGLHSKDPSLHVVSYCSRLWHIPTNSGTHSPRHLSRLHAASNLHLLQRSGRPYSRRVSAVLKEGAQLGAENGVATTGWGGEGTSKQGKQDLVDVLHASAEATWGALERREELRKGVGLFGQKWLVVGDKGDWMRTVAYQAAVHSLLQAVGDIADRGERRDSDIHAVVLRSIQRLKDPLAAAIQGALVDRDPDSEAWLWAGPVPPAVASLLSALEADPRFLLVKHSSRSLWSSESQVVASKASEQETEATLLALVLHSLGSIARVGQATVGCPAFAQGMDEEVGKMMGVLASLLPIGEVYSAAASAGLRREFIQRFASRAAGGDLLGGQSSTEQEQAFWLTLIERKLRGALVREGADLLVRAGSRPPVREPGRERELAVFGFFAALGRATRAYLASKGAGKSEALAGLLRYFEGASVLFFPELARLPSYQLFLEIACEELGWLPFYPGITTAKPPLGAQPGHKEEKGLPLATAVEQEAAVKTALKCCSAWVEQFEGHSTSLRAQSSSRVSRFLKGCTARLAECNPAQSFTPPPEDSKEKPPEAPPAEGGNFIARLGSSTSQVLSGVVGFVGLRGKQADPEAPVQPPLQTEVQKPPVESWGGGKVDPPPPAVQALDKEAELAQELQSVREAVRKLDVLVQGASSSPKKVDLEALKRLKEEVQALEAALQEQQARGQTKASLLDNLPKLRFPTLGIAKDTAESPKSPPPGSPGTYESLLATQGGAKLLAERFGVSEQSEVQASGKGVPGDYGELFTEAVEKLKEAGSDALRGTKLLSSDVNAAMGVLVKGASGKKLTAREQRFLKRTLTDLASIVPIGILMLLPVTAVGHAAILAAIQKYVPGLIPSSFNAERLDVLKQLEEVQAMEPALNDMEAEVPAEGCEGKQEDKETAN